MDNTFQIVQSNNTSSNSARKLNSIFWIYFILLLLGHVVEGLELRNSVTTIYANIVFYIAFALCVMPLLVFTTKQQKIKTIVAIFVFVVIFLINKFFFPQNNVYINDMILTLLTTCLPCFLLALNISDYDDLYVKLQRFAPFYIILALFLIVMVFFGFFSSGFNYMQVAYEVVLPISIIGVLSFQLNKPWVLALFIVSAIALLFIGCRGAFLAVIASYLLSNFLANNKKRNRGLFVAIVLVVFFLLFYKNIILLVGGVLSSLGFSSRFLSMFQEGSLFESAGRKAIRDLLFSQMRVDGYPIYGLFGDRFITQSNGYDPIYAHNIIVEFFVDFGLFGGGILLLCLLSLIIKDIKSSQGEVRSIIIMFVVLCVTKLMFSNSYLVDPMFYCMLGLLFSYRSNRSNKNQIIK